jgi:hypothetical protein
MIDLCDYSFGRPMKVARFLFVCSFLLSFVTAAFALNPDRDIHQLTHRLWGEKEGYPGKGEALDHSAVSPAGGGSAPAREMLYTSVPADLYPANTEMN